MKDGLLFVSQHFDPGRALRAGVFFLAGIAQREQPAERPLRDDTDALGMQTNMARHETRL
jgi:hypothetical protein